MSWALICGGIYKIRASGAVGSCKGRRMPSRRTPNALLKLLPLQFAIGTLKGFDNIFLIFCSLKIFKFKQFILFIIFTIIIIIY